MQSLYKVYFFAAAAAAILMVGTATVAAKEYSSSRAVEIHGGFSDYNSRLNG
jgi:hypothetical protein